MLIGLGLAILIGITIFTIKHLTSTVVDEATDKGRNEVIVEVQEKGIDDANEAKKAVDDLKRNPTTRDAECLRNARNPSDCPLVTN